MFSILQEHCSWAAKSPGKTMVPTGTPTYIRVSMVLKAQVGEDWARQSLRGHWALVDFRYIIWWDLPYLMAFGGEEQGISSSKREKRGELLLLFFFCRREVCPAPVRSQLAQRILQQNYLPYDMYDIVYEKVEVSCIVSYHIIYALEDKVTELRSAGTTGTFQIFSKIESSERNLQGKIPCLIWGGHLCHTTDSKSCLLRRKSKTTTTPSSSLPLRSL